MRCISDLTPDSQTLQLWWQYTEHGGTGNESGGTQWNFEFIRRVIVISYNLVLACWYLHRVKGGDLGRRKVVQGSVNVPSVEAGVAFRCVLRGDLGLVETGVLGVLQLCFSESFVVVNGTVSDELNLRDSRDRLEVGVKDRFGVLLGFVVAVTVDIALGVESLDKEGVIMPTESYLHLAYLRELVLLLRQEINVLEEERVMLQVALMSKVTASGTHTNLVQQLLDLLELLVRQSPRVDAPDFSAKVLKLGRVRSGWEGKRESFDSHCNFAGGDPQSRKRYGTCELKLICFSSAECPTLSRPTSSDWPNHHSR